jgi:hypothetical protein
MGAGFEDDTTISEEFIPMADQSGSWDQATVQAFTTNIKRIVDEWAAMSQNKASQQAGLQDQVNSLFLKWAMDAQGVTHRVANDAATVSARIAANGVSFDNLVLAGEMDTTAQGAIGAKVASEVRSAAKEAMEAAVAAVPGTSAAAQGTTGVAQGAIQSGAAVADVAILAQIAKLAEAVNVLYVKVLGEEVTAEKP